MLKNILLQFIRRTGMMPVFDSLHFQFNRIRYRSSNKKFQTDHPEIPLPPEYMLYESYRLDYTAYYNDGEDTARWVTDQIAEWMPARGTRILEWGCGPARVVRHLPKYFKDAEIHGSDYNESTIEWCRQHIKGVHFNLNSLSPPLPYTDNFFDAVYALSVFTHLSEDHHEVWLDEIDRVMRPGGILLITTQGSAFISRLTPGERAKFFKGEPVIRAQVQEGHRSYSAFQPENYMNRIFQNRWKLLKYIKGTVHEWGPEQDTWIVQKNG